MSSSPSSSSSPRAWRQSDMNERGFLFMLPRLGLPDPSGDAPTIKAAIGIKGDIVDLVVNPSIRTPMRPGLVLDDTAFVPVELHGACWVLFLVKPRSSSPTAPPEFFSLKVMRTIAATDPLPKLKLPDKTEWIFLPMTPFEEQMEVVASPSQPGRGGLAQYIYAGGSAADIRAWKEREQRRQGLINDEVTEQEAAEGEILDIDWSQSVRCETMAGAVRRGDTTVSTTDALAVILRIHPATDGNFRGIDYHVARRSEAEHIQVPEDKWKLLPPQATRPDGERKFVNAVRMLVGKRPFSKEEWPRMRMKEGEQPHQGQAIGMVA